VISDKEVPALLNLYSSEQRDRISLCKQLKNSKAGKCKKERYDYVGMWGIL
jgi:hypothetical protein